MFGGHQAEIGHQLPRTGEAAKVPDFGHDGHCDHQRDPPHPQLAGGEGRHYVGGKQVKRAHALLARQSPPGERTNHVVAATLRCDALHLSAHPVRRSEDDALMLDRRLPREQAVDAVVVVLVPQLRNRPKPHLMCGARRRFCVGVAVGHDDEAQNADFWRGDVAVQSIRVVPMGAPCPLVRVGVLQAAERVCKLSVPLALSGITVSISPSGQAKETPSAGSGVAPPDGEWRLAQIRQLKERCQTQLDAVLAELDSFKRLSWPIHDRLMQTDITTLACSDMSDVWSLAPYRTAATPTSKNW